MDSGRLAELVIGPAEGRTRWLGPGMTPHRPGATCFAAL
jgi:hypothetical protein